MMKSRYISIFIFGFLISIQIFGQTNFRSGYIVKDNGEQIKGLINFGENSTNTQYCLFKKDSMASVMKYFPTDITAYRFNESKYYVRKKINTEEGEKVFFLECLISGKATIYYGYLMEKERYYIEKDGRMAEINNNNVRFTDEKSGVEYSRETNQYKGMLKYYFKDYPDIFSEVDHSKLNKKSMIKISREYHEHICKDEQCIIYEKPISKNKINFGFDVAYGFSQLKFALPYFHFNANSTSDILVSFLIQTNLDEAQRYFIRLSLGYNYNDFRTQYVIPSDMISYSLYSAFVNNHLYTAFVNDHLDVAYTYSVLETAVSIKRDVKLKKFTPFVCIGAPFEFILKEKGTLKETVGANTQTVLFSTAGSDNEYRKEYVLFGYKAEAGIKLDLPGKSENAFLFSINYKYLNTPTVLSSRGFGLKAGFLFH